MTVPPAKEPLLAVEDLGVEYPQGFRRPPRRAVDGVSLEIRRSETLGLVGESGSGKTTISRAILGLVRPATGSLRFQGQDITHLRRSERRVLSSRLSVVFQDPYSSLNPTRTILQILSEPLRVHRRDMARAEVASRVSEALRRVGFEVDALSKYPRHFSGGQRQRIAIARALILDPALVICDEAVSSLDLSIQAQVLNLLKDLQAETGLSFLFISHDLSVVRFMSDRIVVLYRGRVMETGEAATVYEHPKHPYAQALLAAAPAPDPEAQAAKRVTSATSRVEPGGIDPADRACVFRSRCPIAFDRCAEAPEVRLVGDRTAVACHRYANEQAPSGPALAGGTTLGRDRD